MELMASLQKDGMSWEDEAPEMGSPKSSGRMHGVISSVHNEKLTYDKNTCCKELIWRWLSLRFKHQVIWAI